LVSRDIQGASRHTIQLAFTLNGISISERKFFLILLGVSQNRAVTMLDYRLNQKVQFPKVQLVQKGANGHIRVMIL
jgi:hypothetical protein